MADRFAAWARAFYTAEPRHADPVGELAALLRKVHEDAIASALAAVQNQQSYGDHTESAYCSGVDHCIAAVKNLVKVAP